MQYVNLGKTGLKVSRICLGCMTYGSSTRRKWILNEDGSRPFIQYALEAGINFFDTADMYSAGLSEEILSRAIRDFVPRDEVVIATKVYFPMGEKPNQGGLSRKHIMSAIDASLRRLGIDYIDLYQIHRWDDETCIEETLEALHDIVKAGKALYIGASSMYAWQFMKALCLAERHGNAPNLKIPKNEVDTSTSLGYNTRLQTVCLTWGGFQAKQKKQNGLERPFTTGVNRRVVPFLLWK